MTNDTVIDKSAWKKLQRAICCTELPYSFLLDGGDHLGAD